MRIMDKHPTTESGIKNQLLVPKSTASFSGHETFVFRYGWLKKAVDAVVADPAIFTQENAIVTLGVGKNMVRAIRHWGLATQVLEEEPHSRGTRLQVANLGRFLFGEGGKDPYLEDPNTLWLLHWSLMSQGLRCTTWHWAFNHLPSNEFTRESLLQFLLKEVRHRSLPEPSESTLKRDIEVFVRTYAPVKSAKNTVAEDSLDCPFVELELLDQTAQSGHYRLRRGSKPTLNHVVFAYCLADYWRRTAPQQKTMALADIAYKPGSPGAIFKLDENGIAATLEGIEETTKGAIAYSESAGIRQAYWREDLCEWSVLQHYYDDSLVSMEMGG